MLALVAAPAAAAERGFSVTGFDRIRVEGPFVVTVATGKAVSARATGSTEALERVQLRVEGRTLLIRPNMSGWGGFPGKQAAPASIALTTDRVDTAILLGSGSLSIDRVKGARAVLTLEGSGRLSVAAVDVDNTSLAVAGSGTIRAAGRAKQASAIARGAASIEAAELIVSDLTLTGETAATITLNATRSARVTSSGLGPVEVRGGAACEVKRLGSGPISCGR